MSVPMHVAANGLPVGVQVVGRFGEDKQLLQLAAAMEQNETWQHFSPSRRFAPKQGKLRRFDATLGLMHAPQR